MRLGLFPVNVVAPKVGIDHVQERHQDLVRYLVTDAVDRVAMVFEGGCGLSDGIDAGLVNGEPGGPPPSGPAAEPSRASADLLYKGPLRWRSVVPLEPVGPADQIEYGGRIGYVVSEDTRDGGSLPMVHQCLHPAAAHLSTRHSARNTTPGRGRARPISPRPQQKRAHRRQPRRRRLNHRAFGRGPGLRLMP